MIGLIILVFGIIALIDIPPLIRKEQKKELVLLISFLVLAFCVAAIQSFGVVLPSPLKAVAKAFQAAHIGYSAE